MPLHLVEYNTELDSTWGRFKKVLTENEDIFPAKFIDKDLFLNIYG